MIINRREFMRYCAAVAGAMGLTASGLIKLQNALAAEDGPPVVWLQGQGCTGCSVSLLNSIHYMTAADLLLSTIDLEFHATVMAGAGDLAVTAAENACANEGFILVVEGAIPTAANGEYCHLWPGMTALNAVQTFSQNAATILAVGTCAAYGGLIAGKPNPTGAVGVRDIVCQKQVINIPGCPAHPDWIVGTIAHLLVHGQPPMLDNNGRPQLFYQKSVHSSCPNKPKYYDKAIFAQKLGEEGCLFKLGCQGQWTSADCPMRKWNSAGEGEYGDSWCIGARNPCQGCTEPGFPDGLSPWYTLEHPKV
jgi:NiFe hydrogenase small subunit HydA